MNGASTNPDAHVVAYAAAQVKKGLDVAKKLGAENFGESPCGLIFLPLTWSLTIIGQESSIAQANTNKWFILELR